MPLIRLALTVRRHPRAWRLLAGVVVMIMLFAMLLSAVEPAHGQVPRVAVARGDTAGLCATAQGIQCPAGATADATPAGAATRDRPPLHRATPARSTRMTIAAKPPACSSFLTASA